MKLVNVSIGSKDGTVLNSAADSLSSVGLSIRISCYDSYSLNDDPIVFLRMMEDVADADLVTLLVHGDTSYLRRFNRLRESLESGKICSVLVCTDDCVTASFRHLFIGDDSEYSLLQSFLVLGGEDNYRSFLIWASDRFDGTEMVVPEPVHPPAQGIYHPGKPIDFEDYISSLDRSKPCIGIFFYQKQWLTGNTKVIDALIAEIERRGANPVAVFLKTYEEDFSGSIGVRRILDEYLTDDNGPILHAVIETMCFSQTLIVKPGSGEQTGDNYMIDYGVPVIQSMTTNSSSSEWEEDINGLTPSEIAYDIVHPEFDGQIITVPCGSTEICNSGSRVNMPLDDRIERVVDIAIGWARLGMKNNSEKKVAILLYMYPPKNADAGGASGLDTFRSTVRLLKRLKEQGYDVGDRIPDTSEELVDLLLSGITNDIGMLSDASVEERKLDAVGRDRYDPWFSSLNGGLQTGLKSGWGEPMGDIMAVNGRAVIPGIRFGKILVGFQPDRGRDSQRDYHDPNIVMPHQYLAFYRWLKHVFGADAVIHMGTHGTLEWLPGKSVALSSGCCPDAVLDSIPDIYPYIIGNPGEGIQAKRRACAVIIDHMIPAMTRSGGYDKLDELESILQMFMNASAQQQKAGMVSILSKIRESVDSMDLFSDMNLSRGCSDSELEGAVDELYDYVTELKQNLIKDGLHTLGEVPEGKRLEEMIYSLTRSPNGDIPSLRDSVAEAGGYDMHRLLSDPSGITDGILNGSIIEEMENETSSLIHRMAERDFITDPCRELPNIGSDNLMKSVSFVCDVLVPSIRKMDRELGSVSEALSGGFVEPGPSGCPTRGRAQILPTGRNFYSLDPESIPWQSSWKTGVSLADQMFDRYISEYGSYPKEIGIVMWATDTMKTGGDDVAYVLWLLGVRPVWSGYAGRVTGFEIIPLDELKRPRIDVTVRISGLFRDTFPNLSNMIDDAVRAVMSLDESEADNYLVANLRRDVAESIASGIPEDTAREEASVRLFGDAPGTYGSGTNILIRTSDWKDVSDIGSIYRSYGEYAYGRGRKGERVSEAFGRNLKRLDVTVKNSVSREYDMIDNDDVYNDLGGMNAAVRSLGGKMPMSVIGCSADTAMLRTRTIDEECRYIFRSKILNPKWVDGLKEHGFRGAQEISNMMEYVFAWDATSDIIDDWQYRSIADTYLFDGVNSKWLEDANPFAMFETAQWLLEAIGRGMWDADDDMKDRLEKLYGRLESDMEGME